MWWFSAPTNLNRRFLNSGTILEKYNDVVNLDLVATFTLPFGRMHTPRICFLRSMRTVLCRSLERGWDANREMRGWGPGERPDLWPDDGRSEDDLDSDEWRQLVKWMTPFITSEMMRVSTSPSSSPSPRKSRSRVKKKNLAVSKRAMTK